ncbi:MAG: SGNH/GDSL hydrolase family protein [Pseudomonadota bacterium]
MNMSAPAYADAMDLPISADDHRIIYSPSFDMRNPKAPLCHGSACFLRVRFKGTHLGVLIKEAHGATGDKDTNWWQAVIDGQISQTFAAQRGAHVYILASKLPPGEHEVELIRRTEGFLGPSQILGLSLSADAELLPARPRVRQIAVIGDSISCGYGNEASSAQMPFRPETENANMTFGAIAARALDADYVVTCWTGMRAYQDPGVERLFPPLAVEGASAPKPDAVVIALGTNDFRAGVPDEKAWSAAYIDLIKRIRSHYPDAMIYLAGSPMLSDEWPEGQKHHTALNSYLIRMIQSLQQTGDKKIGFLNFNTQNPADGIGADWHPNVKTHQRMAETLEEKLRHDLGWR